MPTSVSPRSTRPCRVGRRRRRAGYSLVELLVAMAVLGILVGAVVPRVNRAGYDADGGARVITGTLQAAQRLAITQQSTVIVGIDLPNHRLRVLEDVNGNLVRDCVGATNCERLSYRPLDPTARFATPPSTVTGGATAALVNVTQSSDGLPVVIFRRDGAASESAQLYLRAVRGGVTEWRGIVVARATGRVDWYARSVPGGSGWTRRTL